MLKEPSIKREVTMDAKNRRRRRRSKEHPLHRTWVDVDTSVRGGCPTVPSRAFGTVNPEIKSIGLAHHELNDASKIPRQREACLFDALLNDRPPEAVGRDGKACAATARGRCSIVIGHWALIISIRGPR